MFKIFSKSKKTQDPNFTFGIGKALKQFFTHKKLKTNFIEELEELLIINDIGVEASAQIINNFQQQKFVNDIDLETVKKFLAYEIQNILQPCEAKLELDETHRPQVLIFNGVNGVGKTTTIGKICANLCEQNKKVLIGACDTFRAGATNQLEIWAKRNNCEIILPLKDGEDPASVAYRALDYAKKNSFDILLIDTAGRLHNKQNLMDELKKINNVIKKIDSTAPHYNLLVLDATTGQNARNQLEIFNQIIGIDGLIITKLDGTAKGGIAVALAMNYHKKIFGIGVGEKIEDLQEFNAKIFSENLLSIT
jgi:fused signal recognition particle receptor